MKKNKLPQIKRIFPDFDSLRIPFFLHSDNQYIVKKH